MHPDHLPTGMPVIQQRRSYGVLPAEERLKVGVVGLHEGMTMLTALRASGLCRAVWVCDLHEEKRTLAEAIAPGVQSTANYQELLEKDEIDIVCLYTPDLLHAEQILQAFRAGKHVLCTKPLVNDASASQELLQAQQQSGKRLQVGQSTRFYEPFLRQRELFDEGEFGSVEAYEAHYCHRMDWWYAKSPWSLTDTHWAYLGLSHPVDLVRWYLGAIERVQAAGSISELGRSFGSESPDIISAQLISETGAIGRVFGHYGMHEMPTARSLIEGVLYGTKGTSLAKYPELKMHYVGQEVREFTEDYRQGWAGYYFRHELQGMHYGEFCNCIDSFAASILSNKSNHPDLHEGLQTVFVMDAIVRALQTGATERVELLEERI